MQVGLKIWRYNRSTGNKELQEFEIDAPEEATLLDALDIVKDRHDGTLTVDSGADGTVFHVWLPLNQS